jgi:hypothetical protein
MDSQTAVDALYRVDPGFTALCETLLGNAVDAREVWSYVYGQEPVVKMSPDSADVNVKRGLGAGKKRKGKLKRTQAMMTDPAQQMQAGDGYNTPAKGSSILGYSVTKADDEDGFGVTWAGEFSKFDEDKRQVFGWASVVEVDGRPVIDRQGDWITPDEIEKAAYEYVVKSRKGGHQHKRTEDGQPFHAADMIESIVFTPEKIAKMGLPDDFPVGWWVGYKVNDDETWSKVKKGDITGFSIHGKGKRKAVGEVAA